MQLSVLAALFLLLTGSLPKPQPVPPQAEPYVLHIVEPQSAPSPDALHTVLLSENGKLTAVSLREYLVRVVLSELYPDFREETYKAQAVAARTVALHTAEKRKHADADLCTDGACCQACLSEQELRQKLGDAYEDARKRAEAAVAETDGEVLYYGDDLCESTYFSCSGGRTESAEAVWGGSVPYLISVDSPNEEAAAVFCTVRAFAREDAQTRLRSVHPDASLTGDPARWYLPPTRTQGNGVLRQSVGGVSFTGAELRRAFGLPSTDFTVSAGNGELVFTVRGSGHRVGMSQFGAEAMAQRGADYRRILSHYYPGTHKERITPNS